MAPDVPGGQASLPVHLPGTNLPAILSAIALLKVLSLPKGRRQLALLKCSPVGQASCLPPLPLSPLPAGEGNQRGEGAFGIA